MGNSVPGQYYRAAPPPPPPPNFLASPVADFIAYGNLQQVAYDINSIPEKEGKSCINLNAIQDEDLFKKEASANTDIRFDAGYNKPIATLKDRDELIEAICMKSAIVDSLPEINQFIDGLKLHDFLDVIQHYPFEARCLFEKRNESSINAEMLDLLFQLEFSTEGSNRRMKEEAIAVNFSRFLDEVEAGVVKCTLEDPLTNEKSEVTLLLSDVLQFITGSPVIPIQLLALTGSQRLFSVILVLMESWSQILVDHNCAFQSQKFCSSINPSNTN